MNRGLRLFVLRMKVPPKPDQYFVVDNPTAVWTAGLAQGGLDPNNFEVLEHPVPFRLVTEDEVDTSA